MTGVLSGRGLLPHCAAGWRQGSKPVIPPPRHRCTKPRAFDAALHRPRHRIEFFFNGRKQFRRVATRYGKNRAQLPRYGPHRLPHLDPV